MGVVACVLLWPGGVSASTLGDFEREATNSGEGEDSGERRSSGSRSPWSSFFTEVMVEVVVAGIAHGGRNSLERVSKPADELEALGRAPRRSGDPRLVHFRVASAYQHVSSDINAVDTRLELGYGPVGGMWRRTRFQEEGAVSDLTLEQRHLVYRMSSARLVQVNLGLGSLVLDGLERHTGSSAKLQVLIHGERFGLDFRRVTGSINGQDIRDSDAALLRSFRYMSARIGYRWLSADSASLDGPYAGLSVQF